MRAPGSFTDDELKERLGRLASDYLLAKLTDLGAVETNASPTGSRYLKVSTREGFDRLRIADHQPRRRYFYRWNLWLNKVGYWQESDRKGRVSSHYGINELDRMANDIRQVMEDGQDNDTETHQDA